jgi:hypothetical protein
MKAFPKYHGIFLSARWITCNQGENNSTAKKIGYRVFKEVLL